ncbi:undecaprenyl-phosphate glucose phosphotransferase [Bdellovibrio sp. HCB2-146]|uniref:undecaprenyl-phosphate glucose phosphotransferase n=1 Tax=Bdellovibrio sp. HCB2-146 TaxID=3394362 RepID=UPI0039BD56FC
MLKQNERSFSYIQKLVDFTVATLSWYGLYVIRFELLPNGQKGLELAFLKAGCVVGLLTIYFFARAGLYRSYRMSSRYEELAKVFRANTLASVTLVVLIYFLADGRMSRSVVLGYYLFSTMIFLFSKVAVRSFLRLMRSRGRNLRHIVVVGSGLAIERYVTKITQFRESGIHIMCWVDSSGLAEKFGIREIGIEEISATLEAQPDSIVIGYQGVDAVKVDQVLNKIYNNVVPIVILPDLSYFRVACSFDYLAGVPAFVMNQPNFSSVDIISKRVFDIVATGIGLILISPVLLFLAAGVRLSSPGPIFFGQERIGLDGRRFKMWKFRSMKVGGHVAESGVPGWTVKDDPRKTKFGSFIRATSLDELPQLWNVFVGDMSLVGPRPEQPYYVEKFRNEIPAYMLRHKMKAGITGWAQVNGWRGDTSLHKRIECDLYYIRHWSLWFDIKILFLTFWKGFINKNAY